ncbi:lipopolysaccharide transport periplasmic protein LptA [Dyella tabacisoli]|nr:lipopolysaccharide transport periplasmic protein LptA [Dyella tabacisoli]
MARSRRANASLKLGLLCLGLLALQPALAKKADRQQAMNYVAKSTEAFNAPNSISTLKGAVKITQGTLVVTGDVAKIHLDGDTQIARVVVTGNPAHIQQLDENNNLMQGDAATIDYDNINGIAVLTGTAVVKQATRGEFHGDKLTYNTDTSLITGESAGEKLVSGTFLPKPKPAAAKPAAAPAAEPAQGK